MILRGHSDACRRLDARGIATASAGGSIWLGVLLVRLLREDRSWWFARDDAVITLSHARNAAEFGSIGVSPIGDRTEGFSSRLHFAVAYVVELLRSWDYGVLTMVIFVPAVMAIGCASTTLLLGRLVDAPVQPWAQSVAALSASTAAALAVAASWSATGWLGSGMENPLVVASSMLLVVVVDRWNGRVGVVVGVLVLAAVALSRVEWALFLAPVAAAIAWSQAERSGPSLRSLRRPALLVGGAAVLVAVVHLGRRAYFGSWLPNTAVAQGRLQGGHQVEAVFLWGAAVSSVVFVMASGVVPERFRSTSRRVALLVLLVAGARLLSLDASGHLPGDIVRVAALDPVLVLAVAIAALAIRGGRRPTRSVDGLLLALASIPVGQYVVMGPARMDEVRVLSISIPLLAVLATAMAVDWVVDELGGEERAPRPRIWLPVVSGWLAVVGFSAWSDGPHYLNWEIARADRVVDAVDAFADSELSDGAIPILANPDLGKVSYAKRAIIVDLGLLGDPSLSYLADLAPDRVDEFLVEVAAPDVVELHGDFACQFEPLVTAGPLRYVRAEPAPDSGGSPCGEAAPFSIWYRVGHDDELGLASALAAARDPVALLDDEIGRCRATDGDDFRCEYVRRAVQRAAVVLRGSGRFDASVQALASSPSFELDELLLRRPPDWGDRAARVYLQLAGP